MTSSIYDPAHGEPPLPDGWDEKTVRRVAVGAAAALGGLTKMGDAIIDQASHLAAMRRETEKAEAAAAAERIMARKRAIRDGGGTNRAARRKAAAMARPKAPRW